MFWPNYAGLFLNSLWLLLIHKCRVVSEDRMMAYHLPIMVQDGGSGDLPMTVFFILHLNVI